MPEPVVDNTINAHDARPILSSIAVLGTYDSARDLVEDPERASAFCALGESHNASFVDAVRTQLGEEGKRTLRSLVQLVARPDLTYEDAQLLAPYARGFTRVAFSLDPAGCTNYIEILLSKAERTVAAEDYYDAETYYKHVGAFLSLLQPSEEQMQQIVEGIGESSRVERIKTIGAKSSFFDYSDIKQGAGSDDMQVATAAFDRVLLALTDVLTDSDKRKVYDEAVNNFFHSLEPIPAHEKTRFERRVQFYFSYPHAVSRYLPEFIDGLSIFTIRQLADQSNDRRFFLARQAFSLASEAMVAYDREAFGQTMKQDTLYVAGVQPFHKAMNHYASLMNAYTDGKDSYRKEMIAAITRHLADGNTDLAQQQAEEARRVLPWDRELTVWLDERAETLDTPDRAALRKADAAKRKKERSSERERKRIATIGNALNDILPGRDIQKSWSAADRLLWEDYRSQIAALREAIVWGNSDIVETVLNMVRDIPLESPIHHYLLGMLRVVAKYHHEVMETFLQQHPEHQHADFLVPVTDHGPEKTME